MPQRLVVSPDAFLRREAARQFLAGLPPAAEALLVGASREAADELAAHLARERGALFGLVRTSPGALAVVLALPSLVERGLAPASALGLEAATARAAFTLLSEGRLPRLQPLARAPGLPRALAASLRDLRLAGCLAVPHTGSVAQRELGELLTVLEAQLLAAGAADRARLLTLAAEALEAGPAPSFAGWPLVLLDLPAASAAEARFLGALVRRAGNALSTAAAGDERALAVYRNIGFEIEAEPPGGSTGLDVLKRRLFSLEDAPSSANPDDGSVVLFSAPGEPREAVEIARRALREAAAGVPFDRMAVLVRRPEAYAPLLASAFSRAGIPVSVTRGVARPDPSGRAFLALLLCAEESLSARRFAEYLSFAEVPTAGAGGAPPPTRDVFAPPEDELSLPVAEAFHLPRPEESEAEESDEDRPVTRGALRAPWRWEKLLVEAAVIGGRDRWARRLAGLEKETEMRLLEVLREEGDDENTPLARSVARTLSDVTHLARFALPVVDALAAFPGSAAWSEWLVALRSLAPRVLRNPERVLAVLAELSPLAAVSPVTLPEVRLVLERRLSTLPVPPPQTRYGRVFVGSPDEARGRSFDVVFVPGLAERLFPERPHEDPMLLDALRRSLSDDLATQTDRAREERLLLRLAVGAARKKAVLSWPRVDAGEGRPRVPSFYALDVARAVAGKLPAIARLESDAAEAGAARLSWPAPLDPGEALDELEYDLAFLARFMHEPDRTIRQGRARYLFELNAALARSLRGRSARHGREWGRPDGLVKPSARAAAALLPKRLTERAYSVSAIQRLAACPYQFALASLLKLEPREEPEPVLRLDPLTKGSLVHTTLARLFTELLARGVLPISEKRLPWALETLERTLSQVAEETREDLAPPVPRVFEDEIESIKADLAHLLRKLALEETPFRPELFEWAFGLAANEAFDKASTDRSATLFGKFRLHGAIDLVERNVETGARRVTDYKTGANSTKEGLVTGGGAVLQPVLYALALENLKDARVDGGRLLFCTDKGGYTERNVPLDTWSRQQAERALTLVSRFVDDGFLPAHPRPGACTYCDFKDVCGPNEEERVARKKADPATDALRELRSLP